MRLLLLRATAFDGVDMDFRQPDPHMPP